MKRIMLIIALALVAFATNAVAADKPNIVLILKDR